MKRSTQILICLLLLSFIPGSVSSGTLDTVKIRAIVLSNILPAISWPKGMLPHKDDRVIIGVFGEEEEIFTTVLKKAIATLLIEGHQVEIRLFPNPTSHTESDDIRFRKALAGCQILYFNSKSQALYPAIVQYLPQPQVLTVGEEKEFCQENGMICLTIGGRRLKIIVNTTRLKENGFRISAEVLQHATLIK